MDNQYSDDYESQAYFPFEKENEPQLSYNWDARYHLVVNDKFYCIPKVKLLDSPNSPNFSLETEKPYKLMEDCMSYEVQSVILLR